MEEIMERARRERDKDNPDVAEFYARSRMMEVKAIEKDQSIPGTTCRISAACVGSDG